MIEFTSNIIQVFQEHGNRTIANGQTKYMRNRFQFFGLKSQDRKALQSEFLKSKALPSKSELQPIIKELWSRPQRELHYFAQELCKKYIKNIEPSDIELYEYMVTHNSWWDTVDFIASHLMGSFFKKYPDLKNIFVNKWLASEHMWLQRCAILFQLKYKNEMDTEILTHSIESLLGSNEFFINKAIGWILREYSKTNPEWVVNYVSQTNLNSLSRKEALRLIV